MSHHRMVALLAGTISIGCVVTLPCLAAPKARIPAAVTTPADPSTQSIAVAIAKVSPALVRIHVVSSEFYNGREAKLEGYGSGVIISPKGYVITNHHVAGNATKITCTLANKEELDAVLIGTDALSDIAVLQLRPAQPRTFPAATFADSAKLRVGDRVFAMGSPLAFSQSVTMGVVSNTALILPETFGDAGVTLDGENVGSIVRWIGHDAEIFPGNSGGPLVNAEGKIVGINEISIGLSGAIPGNQAKRVAEQLISQGRVRRSMLGISVQPLLKSSTASHGVLVTGVEDGSPAETAGFQPGDVLIRLNNTPVAVRYHEEMPLFNQQVMGLPIGTAIPAVVLRDGKTRTLTIVPKERQSHAIRQVEYKAWGFSAANPTQPGKQGVRITGVRTGSPVDSAKPSLSPGDLLLEINGMPVNSVEELAQCTEALLAEADGVIAVLAAFERGEDQLLTVVKLGSHEVQDRGREIRKAWLPVNTQVLTKDLAKSLKLDNKSGVRITQIYPHTSVENSGLTVGDIILTIDGMPVSATQAEDTEVLATMIRQYKIGSTVELGILRDAGPLTISVQLPEAPKLPREMSKYRDDNFDFSARDLAFLDRVNKRWPKEQTGVLVESVTEGSWAALGRLRAGDLLYAVNGVPVKDVGGLTAIMADIAARHPESVVFQVKRDEQQIFLELQGQWTK